VAVGGIALSFLVMMLSIAVVTGFKNEITRKIMGFDAQISVMPVGTYYGDRHPVVSLDDSMRRVVGEALSGEPGTPEVYLTFSQPGMLKTDTDFTGVAFRTYDESYGWNFERGNLVEGVLPSDENPRGITISEETARKLKLTTGDKVNVYFFTDGHIRPRKFEITGIYCSDFGDYDNLIAYAPRAALSKMAGYDAGEGAALEINGLDKDAVMDVASRLQNSLNRAFATGDLSEGHVVTTVYTTGAVYFNWLQMLDTNIVVILVLMGCVSGFMLVSCVLILILERVRMVGVLKSLGATDRQIKDIFVRLGLRVVCAGLLAGNIVGWGLVLLQSRFHLLPLDPVSYYLSYVPVEMPLHYWLMLNAGVAVFAFVLMLAPVGIVGRMSVVKILRFE